MPPGWFTSDYFGLLFDGQFMDMTGGDNASHPNGFFCSAGGFGRFSVSFVEVGLHAIYNDAGVYYTREGSDEDDWKNVGSFLLTGGSLGTPWFRTGGTLVTSWTREALDEPKTSSRQFLVESASDRLFLHDVLGLDVAGGGFLSNVLTFEYPVISLWQEAGHSGLAAGYLSRVAVSFYRSAGADAEAVGPVHSYLELHDPLAVYLHDGEANGIGIPVHGRFGLDVASGSFSTGVGYRKAPRVPGPLIGTDLVYSLTWNQFGRSRLHGVRWAVVVDVGFLEAHLGASYNHSEVLWSEPEALDMVRGEFGFAFRFGDSPFGGWR